MKKRGFTLIELLVSILLVSIILISLLSTLVKIRQTYSIVNENSDVLVYSSSISRVINNDINKNLGINYINCDSAGLSCEITLGNTETRIIKIEEIDDCYVDGVSESCSEPSWDGTRREDIKTTLKYINTTKGSSELIYIKTLRLNRYISSETNKITSEGYNFLNIDLNATEYENDGGTIDVITGLTINIFDGVDESNSNDYDIVIYSANRYAADAVKGKTYSIGFNNMDARTPGTSSMEEEYGVGFFKSQSAHIKTDRLESIEIPTKISNYFEGYMYKETSSSPEKMIVDEEGNIVASNTTFKRHISPRRIEPPYVYAKWREIAPIEITFNANGGGTPSPTNKTVYYNDVYGSLASVTRKGHTFKGWWTSATGGTEIKSDTLVKVMNNQTLYAHWEKRKVTCYKGTYLPANDVDCASCSTGYYCPEDKEYTFNETTDQGRVDCPGEMTSEVGASLKSQCYITCEASKYVKANTGVCSNCPAGNYCAGGDVCYFSESADCGNKACAIGSYSSSGSSTCTACPAGKTTSSTATTSSSSCINCNAITGLNSWKTPSWNSNNTVSNLCTLNDCLAGYKLLSGACVGCGPGTFSASSGSSSCKNCAIGTYSDGTHNSSCKVCGGGKTTSATATQSSTSCINCPQTHVSTWKNPAWNSNSPTNLCKIDTCESGYTLKDNECLSTVPVTLYGTRTETINITAAGFSSSVTMSDSDTGGAASANVPLGQVTFTGATTGLSKTVDVTSSTEKIYLPRVIYWEGKTFYAKGSKGDWSVRTSGTSEDDGFPISKKDYENKPDDDNPNRKSSNGYIITSNCSTRYGWLWVTENKISTSGYSTLKLKGFYRDKYSKTIAYHRFGLVTSDNKRIRGYQPENVNNIVEAIPHCQKTSSSDCTASVASRSFSDVSSAYLFFTVFANVNCEDGKYSSDTVTSVIYQFWLE